MTFDWFCKDGHILHHRSALKELIGTVIAVLFQRGAVGETPLTHFFPQLCNLV